MSRYLDALRLGADAPAGTLRAEPRPRSIYEDWVELESAEDARETPDLSAAPPRAPAPPRSAALPAPAGSPSPEPGVEDARPSSPGSTASALLARAEPVVLPPRPEPGTASDPAQPVPRPAAHPVGEAPAAPAPAATAAEPAPRPDPAPAAAIVVTPHMPMPEPLPLRPDDAPRPPVAEPARLPAEPPEDLRLDAEPWPAPTPEPLAPPDLPAPGPQVSIEIGHLEIRLLPDRAAPPAPEAAARPRPGPTISLADYLDTAARGTR